MIADLPEDSKLMTEEPFGPVAGIVKVTETAGTPLPKSSVTVTTRGCANPVPKRALWPIPDVAVMELAGPGSTVILLPAMAGG